MSTQDTAIVQMQETFSSLAITREPKQVIEEASKAAIAIANVIAGKKKQVKFNGETYLENEDWLLIGRFYGVTSKILTTTYVEFGPVHGWEATAVAYLVSSGQVIGQADGMCLNDEENWGMRPKYEWVDELDKDGKKIWLKNSQGKNYTKGEKKLVGQVAVPLFQLRSMAQTRASSKVMSMLFKWVPILAGFRPTPAEEMDSTVIDASDYTMEPEPSERKRPQRKSDKEAAKPEAPKEEAKPRDPDCITQDQQKFLYVVSTKCKLSHEEVKEKLQAEFKGKDGKPLQSSGDMLKADFPRYLDSVDTKFEFHDKPEAK